MSPIQSSTVPTHTSSVSPADDSSTPARSAARVVYHDTVLLVARVGMGILMLAHAAITYEYGGSIGGVSTMFAAQGIPLSDLVGPVNVIGEFVGGIAMILGLATRLVGAYMVVMMAGAWIWVHSSGLYAMDGNGPELVIALSLLSLVVTATGSGRYAVDHLVTLRRHRS